MGLENKGSEKRKGFISIKYQLMILCLVSVALVVAAMSIIILPSVTKVVKENTESHLVDFIGLGSNEINKVARDVEDSIDRFERMYTQQHGPEGEQDLQTKIDQFVHQNGEESNAKVYVTDANKTILGASEDGYVGNKLNTKAEFNSDGTLNIVFEKDETTGEAYLIFVKGIYVNNNLEGVIYYYEPQSKIQGALTSLSLTGVPSPQMYIIDKDGLLIAHTNADNIGNTSTNEVITKLLQEKAAGKSIKAEPATGEYSYMNNNVTVAYDYQEDTEWFVVVAALDNEVYSNVSKIIRVYFISVVIILLIVAVFIFMTTSLFAKQILSVNKLINKVSNLEFNIKKEDTEYEKKSKLKNEVDEIFDAVFSMIEAVNNKLKLVHTSSENVNETCADLMGLTNEISEKASDTSAVTEQLSAGMQETTAGTEEIANDAKNLEFKVSHIKEQVNSTTDLTVEILKRADMLKELSLKSESTTRNLFSDIKEKGLSAMEQSKAVDKIDEFTKVISDIATQTSMLSLNASIEAARAGEAGKGFAVVADEIGNLAQQSSKTVEEINKMVQDVKVAVSNITECLNMSQEFVENNVYKDYGSMIKVLEHYTSDATNIGKSMNEVDANTIELANIIDRMSESVQVINDTIQQASTGIADIAERNGEIGELTAKSNDMVNDTKSIANELKDSINEFKL